MLSPRRIIAGCVLAFLPTMGGCASGGPDLNGPEGPALLAAYTGDWILIPAESEDLNAKMRDAERRPAGGGGMAGGRPGGAGGGMGGGGRRGGGMRGGMAGGGGMDPEEMRRSMQAIRSLATTPSELTLVLRPQTVTLTENAGNVLVLTLGAEEESLLQGGAILQGKAKWTADGIEIVREMDMGAGIEDKISLTEAGRLVLKREVDLMGGSVKATLVYQRKSNQG